MSNSWFTLSTWALARSNMEPIVSSKKNEAQHRIYEVKPFDFAKTTKRYVVYGQFNYIKYFGVALG